MSEDKLRDCKDAIKALNDSASKLAARVDEIAQSRADAETIGRHGYNPSSVNEAIKAQNRSGRGHIGGKEAKTIHRLLMGRQPSKPTIEKPKE